MSFDELSCAEHNDRLRTDNSHSQQSRQNLGKFSEDLELDFKLFSLLVLVVHTLSLKNPSYATLASLSISIYPKMEANYE